MSGCAVLLFLISIYMVIVMAIEEIDSKVNMISENIHAIDSKVNMMSKNIHAIDRAMLSDKAEEICTEKKSDEERSIAICQWIAENISNRTYEFEKNGVKNEPFSWYAVRSGLCSARSYICVEMAEIMNMEAHIMNLYDFPTTQDGHTCVEIYYDEEWHFFDPTSGGYFRNKDGKIMSLDEMHSNPQEAMDGIICSENALDQVDNFERMTSYFSEESLRNLRSYGVMDRKEPAFVYPIVDLAEISGIEIGSLDKDRADVYDEGGRHQLSQYLDYGLASPNVNVNIQTKWEFTNCKSEKYYLEYYFYDGQDAEFRVISENAEVVTGDTLVIEKNTDKEGVWRIEFIPAEKECMLWIAHDNLEAGNGAFVDSIRIGRVIE